MYKDLLYLFIQTGGTALLDVLTGVVSPAGRLPNTWPASLDQVFTFIFIDDLLLPIIILLYINRFLKS